MALEFACACCRSATSSFCLRRSLTFCVAFAHGVSFSTSVLIHSHLHRLFRIYRQDTRSREN